MRILVTGANGYLGQGVVKELLDKRHDVIATDFDTEYIDNRAEKIPCDLFAIENPYDLFKNPEILLHLAWKDGFTHYANSHIENLPKHYLFLKSMMEGGLKRVAVMGSVHEIGFFEGSVNETTPCHPLSLYGISKNALRDLTQMLAKQNDVQFQWLRGYYIVGNSPYGSSIFSKISASAMKGKKDFPFTLGQNQYDFIDYKEFCKQVAIAVGQSRVLGIINICSGRPEKLADRVERFIKENKYNIRLKYGEFADRPYDSKAIWGDNHKIMQILNAQALSQ